MEKQGQASLEYMVMLGISLAIFAAILYITTMLISSSTSQMGVDSAVRAVEGIKEAADFIYIHGHPSKTRINVQVPSNIEDISIQNHVVKFSISAGRGYTDIYDVTKGNLTSNITAICPGGNCREGYYVLDVESTDQDTINITVV